MRGAGFDLSPWVARCGNAGILAAIALGVSPLGIKLLTGREDLTFRVTLISLALCAFLALVAAAAVAPGRVRWFMFYLIAVALPVPILAGLEVAAIATDLADRIAPIEDSSVYAARKSWPAHFMSDARTYDVDGLRLYRPWQGDGIATNELGLRTESPRPKRPGEWRIAVTGGSAIWGTYVRDVDTIPAQLARALGERGYKNVTVYNFGIEGAGLASELALLERFRDAYALDQVTFYTGFNDVLGRYFTLRPSRTIRTGLGSLELVKAASRLTARLWPSRPVMDAESRAHIRHSNGLGDAIIAASHYCGAQRLRCDFVLQPWLLSRARPLGSEIALRRGVTATFPGLAQLREDMHAGALAVGPAGHTYDLGDALDDVAVPVFGDMVHVNELGNKAIAQRLVGIARPEIP